MSKTIPRKIREAAKLTQLEMAVLLEIPKRTIEQYEYYPRYGCYPGLTAAHKYIIFAAGKGIIKKDGQQYSLADFDNEKLAFKLTAKKRKKKS